MAVQHDILIESINAQLNDFKHFKVPHEKHDDNIYARAIFWYFSVWSLNDIFNLQLFCDDPILQYYWRYVN